MDTITPQQNLLINRLTFNNLNSTNSQEYGNCVVKSYLTQQQGIYNNNNNNNSSVQNPINYDTRNRISYNNSSTIIRNNNNDDSNNSNSSVQGAPILIGSSTPTNNIYNQKNDTINGNNNVQQQQQQQQQQRHQLSNLSVRGINNNNNNNGLLNSIGNNNLTKQKNDNGPILSERYLILKQLPGSSFYNCMDIKTGDSLICKAIGNSYQKILNAYFRMDSFEHIKPLHKLLQTSTNETYLLLPPSKYGDLHSFVRERKRLREPEAKYLFRQICKTVKECHQQGIVLRDLKLRKFVFSDKERTHLKFESLEDAVVLDDYDNDILKEKIGCPAYVAPEILKPNSDFSGKAADLWSLGVILYTMLVGRYPFNDPEHSSLFAKIARCTFTIPDFVSPKAKCLIKSLLQKVPKHRLISDDLLDHQWLQQDSMITVNGGGYDNNNNNISCFVLSSATTNYELLQDDQRVPDIESVEFT